MRKSYSDEKYYDVLFQSAKIKVEYKDFFKNDWVNIFIAKTFVNFSLLQQFEIFRNSLYKDYKESVIIPYLKLEEIRVDRQKNRKIELEKKYLEILSPKVSDSIKGEASLILFDFYLENKDIEKAISILDSIPSAYPQFKYAQLQKILISDKLPDLNLLENYLKYDKSEYESLADIRNTVIFRLIDEDSEGIDSVLQDILMDNKENIHDVLNLIKFYVKNKKWTDCINLIDSISEEEISFEKKSYLQLFKSNALIGMNQSNAAYDSLIILDSLINEYQKNEMIEKEVLISEIESIRLEYDSIGFKIVELMNKSQDSKIISQIDSLKPSFEETYSQIKRYNELVRDAYKKKYDPFNLDILHEDVKKTLRELEENLEKSK